MAVTLPEGSLWSHLSSFLFSSLYFELFSTQPVIRSTFSEWQWWRGPSDRVGLGSQSPRLLSTLVTVLQPQRPLKTFYWWLVAQHLSGSNEESLRTQVPAFVCAAPRSRIIVQLSWEQPTVGIVSASLCSVPIKDGLLGNNLFQMENTPFRRPEINYCHIPPQAHKQFFLYERTSFPN